MVAAPSMIPRRSGDRQKNDKRDAAALAVLHRGGLLTAVWVPDEAHEAMRDPRVKRPRTSLVRARQAAVRAARAARQQLSGFLLRHERTYPTGRRAWTKAHRGWLADQSFTQPAQQIVLEESIEAVRLAEQRVDRVDGHLRAQIPSWSLLPLVQNLCALRGVDVIVAAGLAAAIGDPARFATAPAFMAYLGLVPSEHSSGQRRRMGAITKAGDIHARTMLIEAAHSYRLPARIARRKLKAVEAAPDAVREIAWKAQTRLCQRYRQMMAKDKLKQVVVTAIARDPRVKPKDQDWLGSSGPLPAPRRIHQHIARSADGAATTRSGMHGGGREPVRATPRNKSGGRLSVPGFGNTLPRQDRGRPATHHGLAVTNPRITA
jgi:transposase